MNKRIRKKLHKKRMSDKYDIIYIGKNFERDLRIQLGQEKFDNLLKEIAEYPVPKVKQSQCTDVST